jgi:hypothetical protein
VIAKYKEVDPNADFQYFRIQANSKVLPTLTENLSLVTPQAQKGHGLDLSRLPAPLLSQYILQETWDRQKGKSLFTLGRILKSSEASPQKFLNAVMP